METYSVLEKLKETIKSDFRDLEERCNEAFNKIQHLEIENSRFKELTNQHQEENASLKETLARKYEELRGKEHWWSQYMDISQRRYKAMKDSGTFPPDILENLVNKDISELMNAFPINCSNVKENELSKKHRTLSTLKCKKKVRYNKVSMQPTSGAAEETKPKAHHKDNMHVSRVSEDVEQLMAEGDGNLFFNANESTKLYQNSPQRQGGKESVDGISAHPEILVQETEDVYSEEVADGFRCSIGAPSASSTPLAAAHSPLFGYDNDENDVSIGILEGVAGKSPCDDTVDILTSAKSRLAHLPKSDSQFPVDLSYTQPQSPTIPSRTCSLQQDLNLTADCSVSLLPHGMKNEAEQEQEPKTDSQTRDNDETVFINREMEEQSYQRQKVENSHKVKAIKQTTLDAKYLKTKATGSEKDINAGKRKRDSSDECDESTLPGKSKDLRDEQTKTVFKVPMAPAPKTPEVVLLEEFSSRGTGNKSCSIPLSSSEDMTGLYTSGMDLFGNMDDHCSPDLHQENEREQDASLEGGQNDIKAIQGDKPTDKDKCPPIQDKNCGAEPNYKYVEVVRKRDERAKLNGYKCRDCQEYYQGLNLPENELKKRLKHCSRHRAKFSPPPSTPPGFWNLSFPDTQEYLDKGYLKTESQAPAPKRLRKARRNKIAK
ncbi:DNA endonuclease rbbp8 [Desmophyllum pertusum]|uniref:DNA endonuclease rbbp8 n=1 Tax=Desmophyllum pertusum TaxID=174260 RepID=A0A9X0D8A2_9CNID|nr:DNA endonuclease rbbp8 [Desmophyllum pertusum]